MSKPRERRQSGEQDLFPSRLDQIINMKHELVRLAQTIDWAHLEDRFGAVYSDGPGMPPLATQLMAGLAILKHTFDLSDEEVCARWVENPYFQYQATHIRVRPARSPPVGSLCRQPGFLEYPEHTGTADIEGGSDSLRLLPILAHGNDLARLLSGRWDTSLVLPLNLGLGNADALALKHHVALKLANGGKRVEGEP